MADPFDFRPDDDGSFDELVVWSGSNCIFHAEMMDDKCLWLAVYPPGHKKYAVLRISANSKLKIVSEIDG